MTLSRTQVRPCCRLCCGRVASLDGRQQTKMLCVGFFRPFLVPQHRRQQRHGVGKGRQTTQQIAIMRGEIEKAVDLLVDARELGAVAEVPGLSLNQFGQRRDLDAGGVLGR